MRVCWKDPGWIRLDSLTAMKHYFYEGKDMGETGCSTLYKSTPFLQVFFRGRLERWLKRRIFFWREVCHFQSTWEESSSIIAQLLLSCGSWKNGKMLAEKLNDSALFGDVITGFVSLTLNLTWLLWVKGSQCSYHSLLPHWLY